MKGIICVLRFCSSQDPHGCSSSAASSGCGHRSLEFPTGIAPAPLMLPGSRAGKIPATEPIAGHFLGSGLAGSMQHLPSTRHKCSGIVGTGQHTSRTQHTKSALSLFFALFFFSFSLSTVSFSSL